jgi:iron complex transport system ATP-binding protein
MNVLSLQNISFRRNGRAILDSVDWTVERRRHCALLGANGSGKTTLLKIVTGYLWPTTGTVEVLGNRYGACEIQKVRKAIGWVSSSLEHRLPPRDNALSIVLSGLDATIGRYRTFKESERENAIAALGALDAADLSEKPYGVLSQGEQQRVIIARALVTNPGLLILDEPCAGLDPKARRYFLDDLGRLAERDDAPTMVLVTHHVDEVSPWIQDVMLLRKGKTLQQGTRDEVLTKRWLGSTFDAACEVHFDGTDYWLKITD